MTTHTAAPGARDASPEPIMLRPRDVTPDAQGSEWWLGLIVLALAVLAGGAVVAVALTVGRGTGCGW